MKTIFLQIVTIILLCFSFQTVAQRAKDGNLTVTLPNTIVNTYTYLTANASVGATSITVNSNNMSGGAFAGSLAPGDLILIIQMYGASVDINTWPTVDGWGSYTVPNSYFTVAWGANPETFGQITSYGNAGKFEKAEVSSVSGGNIINLQCGLKNAYDQNKRVQIVRIPRFDNLTVNGGASVTPSIWDGTTGGIVSIEVETALTLNAGSSLDASSSGFRGGNLDASGSGGTPDCCNMRYLGSNSAAEGSEKGESIFGYHTELDAVFSRYGIGAVANGGGGAGYQNCGGGGGSNVQSVLAGYLGYGVPPGYAAIWNLEAAGMGGSSTPGGGRGGYSLSNVDANETTQGPNNTVWGEDNRKTNGGRGGHPLAYDASRLFFGGGGGSGDQDSGQGGAGGRGGGLVYITNYGTFNGSGSVNANGQSGQNSNPNNQVPSIFSPRKGNDGAGGGGAGGSIYVENATAIPGTIGFNVIGGDGGDQVLSLNAGQPWEASGPGGSGSGGSIAFSNGTPTQSVVAGIGGVTNSAQVSSFPPNGATRGSSGLASLPAPYFDLTASDVAICAGNTADLSVSVLGTFPGGSTIQWYTQQFGGASVNSGTTYTTPVLGATTTYYVGVCPGTFRIPITVTVTPSPNLVISDPAAVCAPGTVDLTAPAVTSGSDAGTLTYWNDAGATSVLVGPNAVSTSNTYYIQLDAGGGCTTIAPVIATINPQEDASFTLTPNCTGATASITGTTGGTFSFNTPPGDAAVIDPSTGEITNGTTGSTYDVLYTTPGTCFATSTQMTTAVSDLAYSATITDEACGAADGEISLSASGGDGGPYQYSITGGAPYSVSGLFTGLTGNSYPISVLDNSGCEVTGTETVNSTGAPVVDSIIPTNPSCAGACDGSITVYISGGTPPYSYQWYDGLSNPVGTDSPTLSGLCADNYSVEVTDASGGLVYYFDENFGTDGAACSSQGTLANGYNSGAGVWTTTLSGVNDTDANRWFVSTMEGGVGEGNCGTGCGVAPGITDRTLHLSNPAIPLFGLAADQGAAYNAGGGCPTFFCVQTDVRVESPAINLAGTAMTLTFDYIHQSDGTDECELWYFDGAIWNNLGVLPNTSTGPCGAQHQWAQYSWPIPLVLNGTANFQIGFRWFNNDDGLGTDPSVAIDNIQISESSSACPAIANSTLTDPPVPVLTITDPAAVCQPSTVDLTAPAVTAGSDAGVLTYWNDAAATSPLVGPGSVSVSNTYYIELDVSGCTVIEPVNVSINPADDASFTMTATCDGGTATITGTGGGTFTFNTPPGDAAVIDLSTGTVSGGTSGASYDVLYTTSGACPSSSTQIVTASSTDDPSFTMTATCDGGTATITGTGGGTFSFNTPPGDAAVIDPSTGTVSGGTSGASYDVLYTTSGACPASSTQIVTASSTDDASFTMTATCDGGTATITGTGGGTFSFNTPPGDAAVIDPSTGTVSGGTSGATYDVMYATSGLCAASSTQMVTATAADDPSFTMSATCDGGTATITGTGGGTFTFNTPPGDAAVIDPSTGTVSGGTSGATYDVMYATSGLCAASSAQMVTATAAEDPSFTMSATCDGGTATITGTGGGTFSFNTPPGDAAVIDPSTGTVSGGTSGASYDILYTTSGTCPANSTQPVTALTTDDASFTMTATCDGGTATITGTGGGTFSFNNPPGDAAVIDPSTGTVSGGTSGASYDILYTTSGACPASSTQSVTALTSDDASFTMTATCDGGTAIVTGTGGGTFTFNTPPGDAAVIDPSTGTVSGGTSGASYDILYTTSGTCSASSTQPVTALTTDDASFTMTATCDGGTATITGTGGGTFTFNTPPGDAAVVDPSTGTVSGGTSGASYDILYTTSGTCSVSSTQPVTALTTDDASFTMTATCDGGTATITGTGVGTFTFNTPPGDAAVIDPSTGTVSGGTSGASYDILYTTSGACPSSSTQSITANTVDDPSFNVTATCDGGTATITGTPGGTFSFFTPPGDAAVIDPVTGTVSGGTSGATYNIQYATTGACAASSTQSVTALSTDDASFTTTATCDGGTATVTGTAGGTFSFNTSPGDAAVIDPSTGTVSGGTSGASYDILYTTSGACPASSTQPVTALTTDDASFTITATCDGGTATIIGTGGGTFSFNIPPGDAAVIDPSTGTVSNGTAGANYDVLYVTAGVCPASAIVSFTATLSDDPSFVMTATCDGGTATITGTNGGTFSFAIAPGDAAVIDPSTGTISGGSTGSTYSVQYATSGACAASSTETVTVADCSTIPEIVVPSAFTPNNDMLNDNWQIQDLDLKYPNSIVQIYNRWGNLIFVHESSISNPYSASAWDGTNQMNGEKLPVASYYYIIDPNDGSGEEIKGTVTIVSK